MHRLAALCLLSLTAHAAPAKRRPPPDPAAMQEAMGKAIPGGDRGDRYVSGRALEHYLRAQLALDDGDPETVLAELKLAALYDPSNPYPRYALAKEYERRGQLDEAETQVKEGVALDRAHVPTLVLSARLALARGRPDRAIEPLRRAVQANPSDVEAFALLVHVSLARRDLAGALAVLDRLDGLALAASDRAASGAGRAQRQAADALSEVAAALAAAGRDARAEALLRRAVERDPGEPARLDRLSTFLEEHRRFREAAEVAARGVFLRGESTAAAVRAAQLFLQAGDAVRTRAYVDVVVRFVDAGLFGATDAAMGLGAALLRARAWEGAALLFEAVGRAEADRSQAHLAAGAAWEWLGDEAKARAAYARVPPSDPLALQARSRALASGARAGNRESFQTLTELAAANPGDADTALVLASVLERRGDLAGAAATLEASPRTIGVLRTRARIERLRGQPAAALVLLDELARKGPVDADVEYERALAEDATGRRAEAMATLRRALAIDPAHADAANVLAYLIVETRGKLEQAEALITRALAARPDDPHLLDTFGWVQLALGRSAAAREALRRAAAGAPDDAVIAEHLAIAAAAAGEVDEAREIYGRVVALAEARGDQVLAARASKAREALARSPAALP